MTRWLRCHLTHRDMHKLGEALMVRRTGEVLESYWCRTCKRRWQHRRALSGTVRLPWRMAVMVAVVLMGAEILLLSLGGPDVGRWERPY